MPFRVVNAISCPLLPSLCHYNDSLFTSSLYTKHFHYYYYWCDRSVKLDKHTEHWTMIQRNNIMMRHERLLKKIRRSMEMMRWNVILVGARWRRRKKVKPRSNPATMGATVPTTIAELPTLPPTYPQGGQPTATKRSRRRKLVRWKLSNSLIARAGVTLTWCLRAIYVRGLWKIILNWRWRSL